MRGLRSAVYTGFLFLAMAPGAYAAEGGSGVYLLGFRGPAAGVTPPPGVYFNNQVYFYSGDVSANFDLANDDVALNVSADVILDLATGMWVTSADVLGGNLGFALTVPFGHVDISAELVSLASISDDVFTIGDPFASAFVGWHLGDWHLQTGVAVNIPIGDYQDGEIAQVAKGWFGADVYAALTWLDPTTGIDISNTVGFTFNAEHDETNYRTGTEFHWEWAVVKNFSQSFAAGINGYYYQQLTDDGGSGKSPLLGGFRGEVAAIGATATYNFLVGMTPVSTQVRYYHEFEARNRLEGDLVFLSLTMPLWMPPQ
jgi:hypothetical protein